jgi:hypothetical protein
MPKPAGSKRLPDYVVAPLLRALVVLPAPRHSQLILRKPGELRPPLRRFEKDADFNVI